MQNETMVSIDQAIAGDKRALEALLLTVQDTVYNLSLRMLGSPHDAEDASQEIYIRIITGLSSFKKESAFSTWVYRIAVNHLRNYRKSMFAKIPPLSFEFYGADIEAGGLEDNADLMGGVDAEILEQELKMACTNVMLQCFDSENRLIYVLGIMFRVDSKICGEILEITPEAYRQRLSRIRQKMAGFMKEYCGLAGSEKCACKKRVSYAIANHRLNPSKLEYMQLEQAGSSVIAEYTDAMEEMDEQSQIFACMPKYRSPQTVKAFLQNLLRSDNMTIIQSAQG